MLSFVFAESALELVPKEIRSSRAVVSDEKRRGLDASEILLDRSFHHSAMARLKDSEKRGRPDLVHEALLSVAGTPLFLEGSVRLYVHTYTDFVLQISEKTRLPKNYLRFRGLMEKLLAERSDEELVKVYPLSFRDLIRKIVSPDLAIGLSVQGRMTGLEELGDRLAGMANPCVIVGGFPHGHFSKDALSVFDELLRIDARPLEAHVVASRVAYEVEKATRRIND